MPGNVKVDKILDVKGFLCPAPTVMTAKTLREMEGGKSLKVITNDMTTRETIPSLCEQEGYNLLKIQEDNGLLCFIIRK